MLDYESLCGVLEHLDTFETFSSSGTHEISLYRAVALRYLWGSPSPQPLFADGAARMGARFTPRGASEMRSLYFAAEAETCLYEVLPQYLLNRRKRPPKFDAFPPTVLLSALVRLNRVIDITDAEVQQRLETHRTELRAGWRLQQEQGETPTQRLGRAIFDSGIQAIRYESARWTGHFCYAVFPELLTEGAYTELFDPQNLIPQRWSA